MGRKQSKVCAFCYIAKGQAVNPSHAFVYKQTQ